MAINCRKIFLLRCREYKVFPNFMNFRFAYALQGLHSKRAKGEALYDNFRLSLLNLCIEEVHDDEMNLRQRLKPIIVKLTGLFPTTVLADYVTHTTVIVQQLKRNIKLRLDRKFTALRNASFNEYCQKFGPFLAKKDSWVENLSDTVLPECVLRVMCLGPMFSVPFFRTNGNTQRCFKPIPLGKIISGIEEKIRFELPLIASKIRETLCAIINNYQRQTKRYQNPENIRVVSNNKFRQCWFMKSLKSDLEETFNFCKRNRQIMFVKSDKSNKTVIITRQMYSDKMFDLLDDPLVYKKVKRSLVPSQTLKNNCIIKNWFQEGYISEETFKYLTVGSAQVAKVYGLVKLHKENHPMRPIVSALNTPYQKVAKFLSTILSNIIGKSEYHVRNSFEFFDFINDMEVPEGFALISLDVKSMYTNIPCELALQCVENRWDEIEMHCTIPKDQFLHMLKTCITSTVFQFEDVFYKQVSGLAMGQSTSAVLADIVMEDIELQIMERTPFLIYVYKRYADDSFLIVPRENINDILDVFNGVNPSVQFDLEVEQDQCLNFLDMTLMSKNGKIMCKWYQKATASGRYVNFLSVQPTAIKKNVALNLARRIICLSHSSYRYEMIRRGKQLLIENCYPEKFVNRIFRQVLQRVDRQNNDELCPKNDFNIDKVIAIPYIPFLSENLSAFLKNYGYQVVHKRYNTLEYLMTRLKSATPKLDEAGVVYYIPCKDCNTSYIGHTGQLLRKRLYGHKYDQGECTALHRHQNEKNHQFDFDAVKVLCREKKEFSRTILEMIEVLKHEGEVCNSRGDVSQLCSLYHPLFRRVI